MVNPDSSGACAGETETFSPGLIFFNGVFHMKALRFCSALVLCLVLAACASGPQIRTDFDPSANFASYRTYAFAQPLATTQAGYTTLLTERLKNVVRLQMESRGYVLNDQAPDLLINFYTRTHQRTDYVAPPPMPWGSYYYGYRAGYYGGWSGYAMAPQVIQYTVGILNVDLIDAKRRQLVWEGISTSVINDLQQASSATEVSTVVNAIFDRFPYLAGSGVIQALPK